MCYRSTGFDFKSCLRTREVISRNGPLVLYPFQGAILAVEMAGKNNSTSCSKSNVENKNKISKWLKDSVRTLEGFFIYILST